MGRRTGRGELLAAIVVSLGAVAVACSAAPAVPTGGNTAIRYVSLGDSWVSGPLIPDPVGSPLDCGRSSRNFPRLVASELGVGSFRDVSCGGADIDDLYESQEATFGSDVAPQLEALDESTTLVTLGIGGNDVKFASTALDCVNLLPFPLGPPPFGRPCSWELRADDGDVLGERIERTGPRLEEAIAEIRRRSPDATVLVIGYPTALPDTGPGCWPTVPILGADVRYLRERYRDMNAMVAAAAARSGATFVDTYSSSVGHDACRPTGVAWVNGATLDPVALPMHPNEFSHRATASAVMAELAVLGFVG